MGLNTQAEYEAAYRIFCHVNAINGGYREGITLDQIKDFVSHNKWIVIPRWGVSSIDEAKNAPFPNVYIHFEDLIEDNGMGKANCRIGITYNNKEAMLDVRHKLRKRALRTYFIKNLQTLDETWDITIEHKITVKGTHFYPHYDKYVTFKPSTVSIPFLRASLDESDRSILRRGDIYPKTGTEVSNSNVVLIISKGVTIKDFDDSIRAIFGVFRGL